LVVNLPFSSTPELTQIVANLGSVGGITVLDWGMNRDEYWTIDDVFGYCISGSDNQGLHNLKGVESSDQGGL
jgi:hypothetical protein